MSDDHKASPKEAEEVEHKPAPAAAAPLSAEEEEAKKAPWWKKLSVVVPAVTGLLVALTPLVVLLMPAQHKSETPKAEPTPIFLMQPVQAATPVPTAPPRRNNRPYLATVSTPAGLYMRSGPNEKTNPIIKLEQGAQVKVSNCRTTVYIGEVEGQWCQASFKDPEGNSHRGWMFNAFLIEDSDEA
jgi:hypothetical protein